MASKTLDPELRDLFTALSPKEARQKGQQIDLRPDWERLKCGVMLDVLRIKYSIPELRDKLKATGSAYLEETNTWRDRYWGVDGTGLNMMGHLTMAIRNTL